MKRAETIQQMKLERIEELKKELENLLDKRHEYIVEGDELWFDEEHRSLQLQISILIAGL
jgi:hypothetical protein